MLRQRFITTALALLTVILLYWVGDRFLKVKDSNHCILDGLRYSENSLVRRSNEQILRCRSGKWVVSLERR